MTGETSSSACCLILFNKENSDLKIYLFPMNINERKEL